MDINPETKKIDSLLPPEMAWSAEDIGSYIYVNGITIINKHISLKKTK